MPISDICSSLITFSRIILAVAKCKIWKKKCNSIGKNYILNTLKSLGPGLPAKAAQIFSTKKFNGECSLDNLLMKVEQVHLILQEKAPELWKSCKDFQDMGIAGSLGQVHKATLLDGRVVAVKIQYPSIRENIQNQLSCLLNTTSLATKISFQNFEHYQYLLFFNQKLEEETDYLLELKNQSEFRNKWFGSSLLIIPQIYDKYSNLNILVQQWLEYYKLNELNSFSLEQRKLFAQNLFEIFLKSFFEHHEIHGDYHFGNVGISKESPHKVVLLDFGSMLKLELIHINTIKSVIASIRSKKEFDAFDAFLQLGFNASALKLTEEILGVLMKVFLKLFCSADIFNLSQWNFQEESEKILGKHRLLFYTAAPPWFLMFMRSFTGLISCLKSISEELSTKELVDKYIINSSSIYALNNTLFIPETESLKASFLRIRMIENGKEKVFLEIPAELSENFENIVPDDVKDKLISLGYNIISMKEKIIAANLAPQTIFDVDYDKRNIRVWLA